MGPCLSILDFYILEMFWSKINNFYVSKIIADDLQIFCAWTVMRCAQASTLVNMREITDRERVERVEQ